jgi:D-3-phosphoglycerate dehydrogenase
MLCGPLIVATDSLHDAARRSIETFGRYAVASPADASHFRKTAGDADILVVRSRLPDDVIDTAPRLRAILRHGAGVDIIPVEQASAAGVAVGNVPGTNASAVAQYVLGQLLVLRRRFRNAEARLRSGQWPEGRAIADQGETLEDMTLGIVGYGAVGRALAQFATALFGLRVLVSTPRPAIVTAPHQAVSFDTLVREADAVVLCCPLNAETRGMVDAAVLARMLPHAVLVNVARGAIVDEDALLDALQKGRLGGAVLDVFGKQPLGSDHPLTRLENVVLTPHVAGCAAGVLRRVGAAIADDVRRVLSGELPLNLVNSSHADRIRQRWRDLGPPRSRSLPSPRAASV